MFVVPAPTAVTTPVPAITVATPVLVLLQLPPEPVVVYVVVPPIQRGVVPLTTPALTFGLTVTDCCLDVVPPQPPVMVYIILQLPADTPVTKPEEFTVAIPVLLLLHAPVPPPRTTELAL